jgi:hypothetical protein
VILFLKLSLRGKKARPKFLLAWESYDFQISDRKGHPKVFQQSSGALCLLSPSWWRTGTLNPRTSLWLLCSLPRGQDPVITAGRGSPETTLLFLRFRIPEKVSGSIRKSCQSEPFLDKLELLGREVVKPVRGWSQAGPMQGSCSLKCWAHW